VSVAAIIPAGGQGSRIGGTLPKQFLDLGDGSVMLSRSIEAIASCGEVDEIVVALPPAASLDWRPESPSVGVRVVVATGGARRQDSVRNALACVSPHADLIVVHDAARPFASADLFSRTIRAAREHGAAIAALPASDTVKQTEGGAGGRVISATLRRETIYLAQTPQAFRREILEAGFERGGDVLATDDAALVERAGYPVYVVEGEAGNIKVTTPTDLDNARARVRAALPTPDLLRIGTGYDLHQLVEGRPLVLAGVRIPFDRGLKGHSDADIVCHAVTDAVLGAAALGDIGQLFPDTAAAWKDADSLVLLERAMTLVTAAGYRIVNADATIVAERPKLLPYVKQMRANLARVLGVSEEAVSVKGKTNEQLDATGRGEAMACHAIALLARQSPI
jgi:2-C-methyl-D-erythritol 4-phosphate cytidylyltransferase / 2-C-methyl-D-erythritol 2,4-cyclodiphosphate synthase